jgi:hypothetical protein
MPHRATVEVHMHTLSFVVTGLALLAISSAPRGQESVSAAKAAAVAKLMDQQKLDAVAAQDPDQPSRFVAALYYPGAQLLAVSAGYPSPELLQQRIAARQYRDVYMDLQVPATTNGRLFVMDLQADGLRQTRDEGAFDITYANGKNQVSFDGDWKRQGLSREQYDGRFKADDERYARMLAALERELTRSSTAPAGATKAGATKKEDGLK